MHPREILSYEWILFPLPWEFFRMTTMQAESSRHSEPGVRKTDEELNIRILWLVIAMYIFLCFRRNYNFKSHA